ncbi:histidine phosphatase family protein [Tumebacillus permanentifrigoris]|uniref:2,3-bisphosphoglycerate-dependent phosphoglycerate mutase n=1 Tax=Tumebacillus permanentifrigoris TaxID=378543 RepID=A0A316DD93_9BACL|nr:histidine phosphatase family protein [Tumebacillus permanentifrigoris]PWK15656.1 2,3-bisphosphoglycerate-dependent phosphoglycerate mutase [Tumebacillus permanentifrigoris]
MKRIYVVRHCKAAGQSVEAPLTAEGLEQAVQVADLLEAVGADKLVASPFLRAVQSLEPLAQRLGLAIEQDARLGERVLSAHDEPNWMELLQAAYEDLDLCYEGGESGRTVMERAVASVQDILASGADTTVLASHGGLTTHLLMYFDDSFGFESWQKLSNPDVYLLTFEGDDLASAKVERVWDQ